MAGIFKLLSADVYELLSVRAIAGALRPPSFEASLAAQLDPNDRRRAELRGLQLLSDRICRARTLEDLLRKRLAERCPDVRLVPIRRGRFVLERDTDIELETKP